MSASLMACGGSGGGGTSSLDVTCAPSTVSPTANVSGDWNVYFDIITTTCTYPPNYISCNVTFDQDDDGNVTISSEDNCTVSITVGGETEVSSDYTSISGFGGVVDGTTFYWIGKLYTSFNEDDVSYEETDSTTCDTVASFVSGSETSINTSSAYTMNDVDGNCTSTVDVTFTSR